MLRLLPSDPLYLEWAQLLTMYAQLLNPCCFWDLADVDTDSKEYRADVVTWREHVREMFEELTR
jgi:hypothetical protein